MKIAVTSKNKIKIDAVRNVCSLLNKSAEITGYETSSGVGEQPVGDKTLEGARNRIMDLISRIPHIDLVVSIENGIFREGNKWIDRAVIIVFEANKNVEHIGYSEGIIFPDKYVNIARKKGFDKTTVGQVMEERGFIKDNKDPYISISGIPRQKYLEDALKKLMSQI